MNNFFIKRTFNNFVELAEALQLWNIEIRQLKKCTINDTLMQLKVENFFLANADFSGLTHQIGAIPPGRTFAFYTGENAKFLWRKKDIPHNGLLIFPLDATLDVISDSIKTITYAISFPEEELISRLQKNERILYETIVSKNDVILMDESTMEQLHEVYGRYMQSVEEDPDLIHSKNFYTCLKEELISLLIEIVLNKESSNIPNPKDQMVLFWEKIESYIETHKSRPIMISELAKAVGIGERSLYRMFNDRFSLTPKAYLNTLRLNGVNNDLTKISSSEKTIADIANNWGYWHMGQFAADYKRLFGELPSQTINKD